MTAADFLVEIGTEELPPKALRSLMNAFAGSLGAALETAHLAHGNVRGYASPRRLAVLVENLAAEQPDRKLEQKGPPTRVAFDADGNPTAAAEAFAKKCGVPVASLGREKTGKGEWLVCDVTEKGRAAKDLMPELVEAALASLPIPRRMRWGAGEAEFVRPVHWVVLLHGRKVLKTPVLGITPGKRSAGHRFHCAKPVPINEPDEYLEVLEQQGYVIADFDKRLERVKKRVAAAAKKAGGNAVADDALYDEVTALVEWPVAITGSFDADYLRLPRETIVSTLTSHQRYFPLEDADGALLPKFVTVANLESTDPGQVRDGNERVIRPRLADAAFFWDTDRRRPLSARQLALREVVYQRGLGSIYDKSLRTAALAQSMAAALGAEVVTVQRAATLAKCDLVTGMVGEFPELQGVMGRYYAIADGEPADAAEAIAEHYLPRFAGDVLPATIAGRILAVADRLDTLAGIFAIGKKPSGTRDPFGLRRAALGIIRIVIECELELDIVALIEEAIAAQPGSGTTDAGPADAIYDFIAERLRRYFRDADDTLATETFDAVLARRPRSLLDFKRRLDAVQAFIRLEPAASLAAANKRTANILRQAGEEGGDAVREKQLTEEAEAALWKALAEARNSVAPLLEAQQYTQVLSELAKLRGPVDHFFDDVMVMADDKATRRNRLALLGELRALFLDVADISRLSI